MSNSRRDQVAFLIGRIAVGGMYASAGLANLFDLVAKAAYVASKDVFEPKLLVFLASLLLLVGGISFVLGLRPRIGVAAITMFLIPVTLIMHNFWAFEGTQRLIEMRAFLLISRYSAYVDEQKRLPRPCCAVRSSLGAA